METSSKVDKIRTSCEVIPVFSSEVGSTNPITIIYFPGFQGELNPNFLTDSLPQAEPRISNILSIKFNKYGEDPQNYFSHIQYSIDQLRLKNSENILVIGYSYGCKLALDYAESVKLPCVLLSPISGYIPDMKRIAIALKNRSVNIRRVKTEGTGNIRFLKVRKVLEQGKFRNKVSNIKVAVVIGNKDGIASIPSGSKLENLIQGEFGHYTNSERDMMNLIEALLKGIKQVSPKF